MGQGEIGDTQDIKAPLVFQYDDDNEIIFGGGGPLAGVDEPPVRMVKL